MSHLVMSQGYEIYNLQKQGLSFTDIAENIGVHRATISRELNRDSDSINGVCKVILAQKNTEEKPVNKPKLIRFTREIKGFGVPTFDVMIV